MKDSFIGLVNDIEKTGNRGASVIFNADSAKSIGDFVYLKNYDDFVLMKITSLSQDYYLKNPSLYLINKSVNKNLDTLNESNTNFATFATTEFIGSYALVNDELELIKNKTNFFSPSPLQKVFSLPDDFYTSVLGLSKDSISLGDLSYPREISSVGFKDDSLPTSLLITGEMNSGKSYLASIIAKNYASSFDKLNIYDPHNEYSSRLKLDNLNFLDSYSIYNSKHINSLFIIDEAYTLFKNDSDKFVNFIKLNRKLNNSTVLVTQQKSDIPEELQSQFYAEFAFRDKRNNDLKYLQNRQCMVNIGYLADFILTTKEFK